MKRMRNRTTHRVLISALMLVAVGCSLMSLNCSQITARKTKPIPSNEERIKWWKEAKFGMFIHWGLYSVPAGEWKGEKARGYSEWIMHKKKIPVREYEQLTGQFNPVKFNAEEWVKLAKDAGMKYMVIGSKHHDGFAMYHSKVSPYNIVDATPFKRDPIKELAEACRKEGIKFGCYYSIDRDWHHPDAFCANQGEGNTWDYPDDSKKDFNKYLREKALPQVREILTQYGPIAIIWFDGVGTKTAEQNEEIIAMVRELQPYCLINSRLGDWKSFKWGDYRSMDDNEVADELLPYGWENPGTINKTYGYSKNDQKWKSTKKLIRMLVDIAGKGGNYLLNVGPTGEGVIPQPSVERLRAMGKWLEKNGESIYGTSGSPIGRLPWGRCTAKPGKLYLHVFDWPTDGKLEVPCPKEKVKKAYLLADKSVGLSIYFRKQDKATIAVPTKAPDEIDTVVVLEVRGNLEIKN